MSYLQFTPQQSLPQWRPGSLASIRVVLGNNQRMSAGTLALSAKLHITKTITIGDNDVEVPIEWTDGVCYDPNIGLMNSLIGQVQSTLIRDDGASRKLDDIQDYPALCHVLNNVNRSGNFNLTTGASDIEGVVPSETLARASLSGPLSADGRCTGDIDVVSLLDWTPFNSAPLPNVAEIDLTIILAELDKNFYLADGKTEFPQGFNWYLTDIQAFCYAVPNTESKSAVSQYKGYSTVHHTMTSNTANNSYLQLAPCSAISQVFTNLSKESYHNRFRQDNLPPVKGYIINVNGRTSALKFTLEDPTEQRINFIKSLNPSLMMTNSLAQTDGYGLGFNFLGLVPAGSTIQTTINCDPKTFDGQYDIYTISTYAGEF